MNALQQASTEALNFFLTSSDLDLKNKSILILQGAASTYMEGMHHNSIDVINYDACLEPAWTAAQIKTNALRQVSYDVVIQFAAKSENETKLNLYKALKLLKPTGSFIGIAHNKMGSSRYQKHLAKAFNSIQSISKAKCKVFYAHAENLINVPNYESLSVPKKIGTSEYLTLPGVYGEKAIDKGSLILAEYISKEYWSGMGADIGCGSGFLSGEILKTNHRVKHLELYDNDSRAIEMAELNLKGKTELNLHWTDVTTSIPVKRKVHWAVMNPPFHSGISQDFEIGKAFITQAASILNSGAPLFMVANLHLPYEETLYSSFRSVVKLEERDGYKVWKALR